MKVPCRCSDEDYVWEREQRIDTMTDEVRCITCGNLVSHEDHIRFVLAIHPSLNIEELRGDWAEAMRFEASRENLSYLA